MSSQETKEKILRKAQKEFSTYGYLGARTTTIAKEAGVSRTMLHYHFKTKKDLFEAVNDRVFNKGLGLVQEALLSSAGRFDNVINMIVNVGMDILEKEPDIMKFIVISAMQAPEILHSSSFGQNDQIVSIMDQVINEARKNHPDISPKLNAEQLLLNILGMSVVPYLLKDYMNLHMNRSDSEFSSLMQDRREIILELLNKQLF